MSARAAAAVHAQWSRVAEWGMESSKLGLLDG